MKIYELNERIENSLEKYYEAFDENGELVNEELYNEAQKELEELQNKKDEIKEWALNSRQNTLSNIIGIENEIKRLNELKEKQENKVKKADRFIEFLFKDTIKDKKVIFGNFELGYRKSKRLEILDESKISDKYKVFVEEQVIPANYKIDKNVLKDFIKKGENIEGAEIKEVLKFNIK